MTLTAINDSQVPAQSAPSSPTTVPTIASSIVQSSLRQPSLPAQPTQTTIRFTPPPTLSQIQGLHPERTGQYYAVTNGRIDVVEVVEDRAPKRQITLSLDTPSEFSLPTERVERSVRRIKTPDVVKGMRRTKLFKATVVSAGFTLAALFGAPTLIASAIGFGALLAATPPGWIILGLAVAGFVIGYLLSSNKGTVDKTEAETIPVSNKNIHLQAFPSRFYNDAEKLANEKNVGLVLSCNKPSEREHCGTRIPYTDEDFADLGITYYSMNVNERGLLTQDQLELGARAIHKHLSAGENICVSGEAGRQAIAAYLLMYSPTRTVEEAMRMAGLQNSIGDVRRELLELTTATRANHLYNSASVDPSGLASEVPINFDRMIVS